MKGTECHYVFILCKLMVSAPLKTLVDILLTLKAFTHKNSSISHVKK